jgi:ATP-dependent DNA helicase RecG
MAAPSPMNRLLQGDVGSGKTAVAAALIYNAAKNGLQSALMARPKSSPGSITAH